MEIQLRTDYCLSSIIWFFFISENIILDFFFIFKNLTSKTKTNLDDILVKDLQKPLTNLVVIGAYYYSLSYLHFDKNIETVLVNIAYLLIIITITSIASKIVDSLISEVILPISKKTETSFDSHLIPVIQKAVRVVIWSLGIVIGLDNIGFDITAMIAGLGIGGLALALAAQDSVKNIFAGIMIFLDKPFKINDRIKNRWP